MPREAPVTRAVRPSSRLVVIVASSARGNARAASGRIAGLPAGLGDRAGNVFVSDRPAEALVARRANDGLRDRAGHAPQVADGRIERAGLEVGVGDQTGETLGGREDHAVADGARAGHERAETDARKHEGVVALA